MMPEEFDKQVNGGDDVFMCRYLYDTRTKRLIRIAELDGGVAVTSPRVSLSQSNKSELCSLASSPLLSEVCPDCTTASGDKPKHVSDTNSSRCLTQVGQECTVAVLGR